MAKHLEMGAQGEELAKAFLLKKGYLLRAQNWRHKHLEVDLIMQDGNVLVFVEVKTRQNSQYGHPYEGVRPDKIRKLARAANLYMVLHNYEGEIRFDIVSVIIPQNLPVGVYYPPDINHYEDAFWP
jgi:putative endonuclease